MALIADGRNTAGLIAVEQKTKAGRFVHAPRGSAYSIAATTGTIAAAQAAGSAFFAMRVNPSAGNLAVFIERVRLQVTTIAAFTVPVTAGRRLSLYRGSAAAASGGTAYTAPNQKDSNAAVSQTASANTGDIRFATTAGLTTTNMVFEANPFREAAMVSLGTAGANYEWVWELDPSSNAPIILSAGQVLALRNPQVMDAGGTFQLSLCIDWHESVGWASTVGD